MNKRDLKRFGERLVSEKTKILRQSDMSRMEDFKLHAEDLADEVDQACSERNQNMAIRLRDRERHLLRKIEKALTKIHLGTFGTCEECEEPIEAKRLEARPVAQLCIQCKEDQELAERIQA